MSKILLNGERKEEIIEEDKEHLQINGEFLGYRYQFTGSDLKGGICVIMDHDGKVKELVISEKDLKEMDAVTYIENEIEQYYQKQKY